MVSVVVVCSKGPVEVRRRADRVATWTCRDSGRNEKGEMSDYARQAAQLSRLWSRLTLSSLTGREKARTSNVLSV